jgi:hypothetical protein
MQPRREAGQVSSPRPGGPLPDGEQEEPHHDGGGQGRRGARCYRRPGIALKVRSNAGRPLSWRWGAAAVAAIVAVGVLVAGLRWRGERSAPDAGVLLAAPEDAWLILTVDVRAAAPLLEPFFRGGGGLAKATSAAGLGSLSEACGFDPVEHLRELMVAVPEGGDRGDFGVAFSADLTMDELAACARKAIAARGGAPSTTMRGGFTVIGDDQAPTQARLAYRDRGPFLVGRGVWLEAMIDAALGRAPRARPEHEALRAVLAPTGSAARALVVTALLPKSIRDRIRAETDAGAGGSFAGVLGVEEAGAAVTTSESTTALEVELRCETPASCGEVKELVERARLALAGNFSARLMGLGPLIDGLSIDAAVPGVLALRTRAPTGDLAQALVRVSRVAPPVRAAERP